MQAAWIYKERFDLPADAMVLLGAPAAVVDALHMATDVCWWFHVRSLAEQRYFYAFSLLSSNVFLDVAESTSLPRSKASRDCECLGRNMSVTLFGKVDATIDGIHVFPFAGGTSAELLSFSTTLAEISKAARGHPAIDATSSARHVEASLESRLSQLQVIRFPDAGWVRYSIGSHGSGSR